MSVNFSELLKEMYKPEYRRDNWHDLVPSLASWTFMDKIHKCDTGAPKRYVYFIRWGEFIKIGCSSHPEERLQQISYRKTKEGPSKAEGKPYLIGYLPGSFKEERNQHKRWKHLHDRGEWFRAEEDLIVFAEEARLKQAAAEVEVHELNRQEFCKENGIDITPVDIDEITHRHLTRKVTA